MPLGLEPLIHLRAVIAALEALRHTEIEVKRPTAVASPKEYSRRGLLVQRYAAAAGFVFL
jgi:hypothetical protein